MATLSTLTLPAGKQVLRLSDGGIQFNDVNGNKTVLRSPDVSKLFDVLALAKVASIAVTPPTPSIAAAATQQFVATATFADGSTSVITTKCAWTSSDATKATVGAATGLATGVAAGSATITATFGGLTATAALTVTA